MRKFVLYFHVIFGYFLHKYSLCKKGFRYKLVNFPFSKFMLQDVEKNSFSLRSVQTLGNFPASATTVSSETTSITTSVKGII